MITDDDTGIRQLGALIEASIKAYGEDSPRSRQSNDGVIGMSDLGFCRQKALLMLKGVPKSDPDNINAAQIGTAIHAYYGEALRTMFPNWVVEAERLTATFPGGYQVPGTPDLIVPEYNALIDLKTVDGLQKVSKYGPSNSHRYQRFGYALAAIQAGILDGDKPVWVANYYIDRSAREGGPYFQFEKYDPLLADEISEWISDVVYAAKHGEDASRDIPSAVCKAICSHYSVCRGGLEVHDGNEIIDDPDTIALVDLVVKGKAMQKEGERMYDEGRLGLQGINGVTPTHQIRWVEVGSKGSMRLDIDEVASRP